jgi:hypothetical protein
VIDELIEAEDGAIGFEQFVDPVTEQVELAEGLELTRPSSKVASGRAPTAGPGTLRRQAAARSRVGPVKRMAGGCPPQA